MLGLAINFDVIEPDPEHVLEEDVVPVDVAIVFGMIIIPESKIRRQAVLLLILHTRKIKCKKIAFQQILFHHFVENGRDAL